LLRRILSELAKVRLVTEPSAVAPDPGVNYRTERGSTGSPRYSGVDAGIRRYRARFCTRAPAKTLSSPEGRRALHAARVFGQPELRSRLHESGRIQR